MNGPTDLSAAVLTSSWSELTLAASGRLRVADVWLSDPEAAVDAALAVV